MVYATCTNKVFDDTSENGIAHLRVSIAMDELPSNMAMFGPRGHFKDQIHFYDSELDDEDRPEGLPYEISFVVFFGLNPGYDAAVRELLGETAWLFYSDTWYHEMERVGLLSVDELLVENGRNRALHQFSDEDALRMLLLLDSMWNFIPR